MDFLFDVLVEAFFELFGEGFISLCSAFVPQKVVSEKGKKIIGCVCLAISLVLLVGLLVGTIILVETKGQSFWGWLLVSLNILYLLAGVTLKIVSYIKKIKKILGFQAHFIRVIKFNFPKFRMRKAFVRNLSSFVLYPVWRYYYAFVQTCRTGGMGSDRCGRLPRVSAQIA